MTADQAAYVLVVEDEPRLAALVSDYLRASGMETAVLNNGSAVVASVRQREPDLIVLDLMLPGTDGLTVCRALREFTDVPVLMLTARVEEIDRLIGLEAGADDYVCKPFSPREVQLRAQLRAQLQALPKLSMKPACTSTSNATRPASRVRRWT